MSFVIVSISDNITLKVIMHLCVFHLFFDDKQLSLIYAVLHPLDTEIKGDILFLGYYESEFDWNNETAKVKSP